MRGPFGRLVGHFVRVIVNSGSEDGGSDLDLSIGAILALLAVPGAFMSLSLFDKYSSLLKWMRHGADQDPFLMSIPDKYFFIVFSMVVTGVIATLKWDRIFPSRQDYGNLAPLPFPARNIFLANLAAIAFLGAIFAVDVNAASAVLFPFVVVAGGGAGNYLAFVAAHAVAVILASAFMFFACFAIVGGLLSVLPDRAFGRISLSLRLALMLVMMGMLCTSFTVPRQLAGFARHPDSWVRWLPPVWYLAVYQSLQGRGTGEWAKLAGMAWQAAGAALVLAVVFGVLSYVRYFRRIPETSDARRGGVELRLRLLPKSLERIWLRSPFQRACYQFGLRALLRNEPHCILVGSFVGLGLILGTQFIANAEPFAAPLCVAFFLLTGLRLAFELPAGVRANWVFRLSLHEAIQEAPAVGRKLMVTFLVPVVLVPCLLVSCWTWGGVKGAAHTAVVAALCWLLMELLLLRFRKVPFACALPNLQNSAIVTMLIGVMGYFVFTGAGSQIEQWMWGAPVRFWAVPVLAALAWWAVREMGWERDDPEAGLVYEEPLPPAVQRLDIAGLG